MSSSPPASYRDVCLSRPQQSFGSKLSQFIHTLQDFTLLLCFSSWSYYVPLFGTLVNLGFLYWKRHSHPLNLVLLTTFTLLEAFSLGVVTAFFDNKIVLQAL